MSDKRAYFHTDVGTRPAPEAYYSSGRWLLPQRYVIGWRDHDLVKVGTTTLGRRRYGMFLARGGEVLDLRNYKSCGDLDAELSLQSVLDDHWPRAFASRHEAAPFLGNKGSGWTECFRIPTHDWSRVLEHAGGGA